MTERRIESLGALDGGLDGSAVVFVVVFVVVWGESRPGCSSVRYINVPCTYIAVYAYIGI